jgi:hypothetical protein
MPIDLLTLDPTTLKAGPTTDAMACGWCEPMPTGGYGAIMAVSRGGWWRCTGPEWIPNKQPSTNHAHAVEALLKARESEVRHRGDRVTVWILEVDECEAPIGHSTTQRCRYDEVTGDTEEKIKGKALALATCRAIVAAMVAKEKARKAGK